MEDNKLSKFERLLLINQFMILKEINDIKEHLKIKENQKQDDQIEYLANIGLEDKIIPLIKGFPKCINDIFVDIDDFVSKKKIDFIHKVLSMYCFIYESIGNLPNDQQNKLKEHKCYKFGFSITREADYYKYIDFYIDYDRCPLLYGMKKELNDFEVGNDDRVNKYYKMLDAYDQVKDKIRNSQGTLYRMPKEDILQILNA